MHRKATFLWSAGPCSGSSDAKCFMLSCTMLIHNRKFLALKLPSIRFENPRFQSNNSSSTSGMGNLLLLLQLKALVLHWDAINETAAHTSSLQNLKWLLSPPTVRSSRECGKSSTVLQFLFTLSKAQGLECFPYSPWRSCVPGVLCLWLRSHWSETGPCVEHPQLIHTCYGPQELFFSD